MQHPVFETTSRHLEQFLFMHDIHWLSTHRNPDHMPVWVYELTEEVQRVIDEFHEVCAKRKNRRLG